MEFNPPVTNENLMAMGSRITKAASLVAPDEPLDVIAYCCTSCATNLGDNVVCENIKLVHAPHKTPIGALRNISVDNASGKYVATWDDDDIHHAERLRLQYEATIRHKKDGCLLLNALFHNMNNGDKGIMKDWYGSEASLFIIKSSLKRYDDELTVSEDTPIVRPLLKENKLTILAKPQLYIYRFHK